MWHMGDLYFSQPLSNVDLLFMKVLFIMENSFIVAVYLILV